MGHQFLINLSSLTFFLINFIIDYFWGHLIHQPKKDYCIKAQSGSFFQKFPTFFVILSFTGVFYYPWMLQLLKVHFVYKTFVFKDLIIITFRERNYNEKALHRLFKHGHFLFKKSFIEVIQCITN